MRTRTLFVTVVLLALVSVGLLRAGAHAPLAPPASASRVQEAAPGPGVATIWYLGHCGYAVKTARHLLLFDYIELEEQVRERGLSKGFVDPAEIAAANLSVFVSHSHLDHYDPVILDLGEDHSVDPVLLRMEGWSRRARIETSRPPGQARQWTVSRSTPSTLITQACRRLPGS